MTVEELIEQVVHDAVLQTAFDKPTEQHALSNCLYVLKQYAVLRFTNPLVFNKMRELLGRRKVKA
mgnify:CR=1 FL=1